jgi:5-methylcytosine-specific restriction endonuclease McrA
MFTRCIINLMKVIKCIQCGKNVLQKSKRVKKFCNKRCAAKSLYWKNQERYNAYSKKFYYKNPEYHIKRSVKWQKKNPEKAREQNNRATQKYKEKTRYGNKRQVLMKKYGGCQKCGSQNRLQVHHVDRVSYHNSPTPNNKLDNLMLLCQSCHLKGHWAEGNFRKKRKSDTLSN